MVKVNPPSLSILDIQTQSAELKDLDPRSILLRCLGSLHHLAHNHSVFLHSQGSEIQGIFGFGDSFESGLIGWSFDLDKEVGVSQGSFDRIDSLFSSPIQSFFPDCSIISYMDDHYPQALPKTPKSVYKKHNSLRSSPASSSSRSSFCESLNKPGFCLVQPTLVSPTKSISSHSGSFSIGDLYQNSILLEPDFDNSDQNFGSKLDELPEEASTDMILSPSNLEIPGTNKFAVCKFKEELVLAAQSEPKFPFKESELYDVRCIQYFAAIDKIDYLYREAFKAFVRYDLIQTDAVGKVANLLNFYIHLGHVYYQKTSSEDMSKSELGKVAELIQAQWWQMKSSVHNALNAVFPSMWELRRMMQRGWFFFKMYRIVGPNLFKAVSQEGLSLSVLSNLPMYEKDSILSWAQQNHAILCHNLIIPEGEFDGSLFGYPLLSLANSISPLVLSPSSMSATNYLYTTRKRARLSRQSSLASESDVFDDSTTPKEKIFRDKALNEINC